jgi:hypothetical protein
MFNRALTRGFSNVTIKRNENQAVELAKYAKNFMDKGKPAYNVIILKLGPRENQAVPH